MKAGKSIVGVVEGAVSRAPDECEIGHGAGGERAPRPVAERRLDAGGSAAITHGNRGRPSPRRLPFAVREAVVPLDDDPLCQRDTPFRARAERRALPFTAVQVSS